MYCSASRDACLYCDGTFCALATSALDGWYEYTECAANDPRTVFADCVWTSDGGGPAPSDGGASSSSGAQTTSTYMLSVGCVSDGWNGAAYQIIALADGNRGGGVVAEGTLASGASGERVFCLARGAAYELTVAGGGALRADLGWRLSFCEGETGVPALVGGAGAADGAPLGTAAFAVGGAQYACYTQDQPSAVPTALPSPAPSETFAPSTVPTAWPSPVPIAAPTPSPSAPPTAAPTAAPTAPPTVAPTAAPSYAPTTYRPTATPTTSAPTHAPPTRHPTPAPSLAPTPQPTTTLDRTTKFYVGLKLGLHGIACDECAFRSDGSDLLLSRACDLLLSRARVPRRTPCIRLAAAPLGRSLARHCTCGARARFLPTRDARAIAFGLVYARCLRPRCVVPLASLARPRADGEAEEAALIAALASAVADLEATNIDSTACSDHAARRRVATVGLDAAEDATALANGVGMRLDRSRRTSDERARSRRRPLDAADDDDTSLVTSATIDLAVSFSLYQVLASLRSTGCETGAGTHVRSIQSRTHVRSIQS